MSSSEPEEYSIFTVDLDVLAEREVAAEEFKKLWYSDDFEAMRNFAPTDVAILWTLANYFVHLWDPTAFCYAWFRFNWESENLHSIFQEKILDIARDLRADLCVFDCGVPSTLKDRMARKEEARSNCYKWISILYTLVPKVLNDTDVINKIFLDGKGETSMTGWSSLTPERAGELKQQWNTAKNTRFEFYNYMFHTPKTPEAIAPERIGGAACEEKLSTAICD